MQHARLTRIRLAAKLRFCRIRDRFKDFYLKFIADTIFFSITSFLMGVLREHYIGSIGWNDCLTARAIGFCLDILLAGVYGMLRDSSVYGIPKERVFLRTIKITTTFTLFWGVVYAFNLLFLTQVKDVESIKLSLKVFFCVSVATTWIYDYFQAKTRLLIKWIVAWIKDRKAQN